MSLARRHMERQAARKRADTLATATASTAATAVKLFETLAAASGAKLPPLDESRTQAGEILRRQLLEDRRRLKDVQSMQGKAELKAQLLPNYAAWVQGILQADQPIPDDISATVLLWQIDAGQLDRALPLIEHFLRHKLPLADNIKRTTATAVAEESAELALAAIKAGTRVDPVPLQRLAELTAGHDMPDPVRARLFKAVGLAFAADPTAIPRAHRALSMALEMDPDAGVKGEIKRLGKLLEEQSPPPPVTPESSTAAAGTPAGPATDPERSAAPGGPVGPG